MEYSDVQENKAVRKYSAEFVAKESQRKAELARKGKMLLLFSECLDETGDGELAMEYSGILTTEDVEANYQAEKAEYEREKAEGVWDFLDGLAFRDLKIADAPPDEPMEEAPTPRQLSAHEQQVRAMMDELQQLLEFFGGIYTKDYRKNNNIENEFAFIVSNASTNTRGFGSFDPAPYGYIRNGNGLCLKEPAEKHTKGVEKGFVQFWQWANRFADLVPELNRWIPTDREGKRRFSVHFGTPKHVNPHTDPDAKDQFGFSMGDFSGGELVVTAADGTQHAVNTRYCLTRFEGRLEHFVLPWEGERYNVFFFVGWVSVVVNCCSVHWQ
jgi:hypothetical protein